MTKDFFSRSIGESIHLLKTKKDGLSEQESQIRQQKCGPNILKTSIKPASFKMFLKQFKDIMTIILLVASMLSMGIAFASNSASEMIDGIIILGIVFLNAFIGFWQEKKAQKSMEQLKTLTEPEAKVLRIGKVQKIKSTQVCPGDIIVLEAGDIVPADARLIECIAFKCDESMLTGESLPAEKDHTAILPQATILADRKNMVFSGSVATSGRALAVVTAIGHNTELGKIANMLLEDQKTTTPLQKGIQMLAKITTYIVLAICAITFLVEILARPDQPLSAFLTAVALAVAAIPESLPAVITIIMSLGTFRLAKQKAIIKHLHAIETLGCCQVICSDKTGTITQNKLKVQNIFCGNKMFEEQNFEVLVQEQSVLIEAMALCESVEEGKNSLVGDPTELALVNFALKKASKSYSNFQRSNPLIGEIPFDSNLKYMTSVRQTPKGATAYTKGAVDEVIKKCNYVLIDGQVVPLFPFYKEKILRANKEMATDALRVLAFAYKQVQNKNIQDDMSDDLIFVGLVGMIDPPRPEVKKAVSKCKKAHITPIMITGDHKNTAFAIAQKIGISQNAHEVITGAEIDQLSDEQFLHVAKTKRVFARVSPENKVRIVEAFKKQGLLVAMTGDGVNDAPSIKKADIGIGMGQNGTDVTKEVADVIITDDNFATIVIAVEEGRKTYANIQKTIQFLFTANLAEITAIFLATLLFPGLIFLSPVQILFVNLISDTLPAIALGVEPAEKNLMNMPPRNTKKSLLANGVGTKILVFGILQGLIMLSCFLFGLYVYQNNTIATTMAFYALNIVQFFYFVSMRTTARPWRNPITQNRLAVWAVLSCFIFVGVVAITPLGALLGLEAVPLGGWLFIGFASFATFVFSEILKTFQK